MIKKHNILGFKNLLFRVLCLIALNAPCFFSTSLYAQSVVVFAGNDQIICTNDTLEISNLNASISGAVTNGYWFTNGDGYFLPIQQYNRFSLTTQYVPGTIDKSSGYVNLILVSDDPDGIGPLVQVTDQVKITFMGNVALVCNNNLNISLNTDCTQKVTPSMLVTNIQQPINYYTLTIKNQFNQAIPNNTLTNEHIGKNLEYTIGHECGSNTCTGYINVQDKLAPPLYCSNKTVLCGTNTLPDSIGLPIPSTAKAKKSGLKKYRVTGLDACGPATLSYSDVYQSYTCENPLQGKITRTWTAVDSFGNSSTCIESISIKSKTLAQVVLPLNYDGTAKPAFECDAKWPKLPNGFPSPDTTGVAQTSGCTNLESTYVDSKFEQCGASYKILRKWTIINWCGTLTLEHNQFIKVKDSKAPIFDCPGDLTIQASAYDCANGIDTLPYPKNVVDCSSSNLKIDIYENGSNINFSYLIFAGTNGKLVVSNLPVGIYAADYIMIDACGNSDTCRSFITVIDKNVPIAICDHFTKVSLTSNGIGRMNVETIDDGSFDNCQVATLKVAKMTDVCGNTPLVFGDYVDYCCAEANTSVMTILRVTDNFGNSNSCMVEVQVQDKINPTIFCPSNLTISCKNPLDTSKLNLFGYIVKGASNTKPIIIYDEYNNGIAGYDGYYLDNCDATITTTFKDNTKCHQGTIIRTFTATDKNNNIASCQQSILVKDPLPFNNNHITWPNPTVELNGCDASVATLTTAGQPVFSNINCANVAATFDDKLFYNTDGVCVKILREWTVLDWCQFDPATGIGKWIKNQTIKISNATAPQFTTACKDTTFCLYTENCGSAKFTYAPSATDDCTLAQDITATWKIDINNDGSIDSIGSTRLLGVYLKEGKHKIYYTIIDKCHNETSCSFIVTAMDCKKPTPYCTSQLTSVIMPNSGTLSIKAKSFDLGSFDNCTDRNKLKFSFSTFVQDSIKILTCADIENGVSDTIALSMYVIDLAGNKEYCKVDFVLYDNDDICQDKNLTATIIGQVLAPDLTKKIQGVEMRIEAQNGDYSSSKFTDAKGQFSVSGMPANMPITVRPIKSDSVELGLSTLDVILIQKHILGTAKFNDPYKIIASDVDNNKKISVSDLVVLRKIILGVSTALPKNRNCYAFVQRDFQFSNINTPFNYPDTLHFKNLNLIAKNNANFVGIKIGDVNNTIGSDANAIAGNRTTDAQLRSKKVSDRTLYHLDRSTEIMGLQLKFESPQLTAEDFQINEALGEAYFEITNGKLIMMIYNTLPINIDKDQWLFTIKNNKSASFDQNVFNEYYDENQNVHPLIYGDDNENFVQQNELLDKLKWHMADGQFNIYTDVSLNGIEVSLSDMMGRELAFKKLDLTIGNNIIDLKLADCIGLKIVTIRAASNSRIIKLF